MIDPTIQRLTARVNELKKSIKQLEGCVQVDSGQSLVLKAGLKVLIQAGASVSLKTGGVMKLKAGFIQLNPPSGQSPSQALSKANTTMAQLTKSPVVSTAAKTLTTAPTRNR